MTNSGMVSSGVAGAVLWGVALVVIACTVPLSTSRETSVTGTLPTTEATISAPGANSRPGPGPAPLLTVPPAGDIETSRTLIAEHGLGVLFVAGAPLIVAITVGLLLFVRGRLGRVARVVAWGLTGLAFLIAVLGALTIGPLIWPVAVALLIACAARDASPPPSIGADPNARNRRLGASLIE